MPFVGEGQQGFGEHGKLAHFNGEFPFFGALDNAFDTNDVADISEFFEVIKGAFEVGHSGINQFFVEIELNGSSFVLEAKESQFSKHSTGEDSSGNRNLVFDFFPSFDVFIFFL